MAGDEVSAGGTEEGDGVSTDRIVMVSSELLWHIWQSLSLPFFFAAAPERKIGLKSAFSAFSKSSSRQLKRAA